MMMIIGCGAARQKLRGEKRAERMAAVGVATMEEMICRVRREKRGETAVGRQK